MIALPAQETVFASEISGGVLCLNYCSRTYKCVTTLQHRKSGTSSAVLQLHNTRTKMMKALDSIILTYFSLWCIGLYVRKTRFLNFCTRCRGVADGTPHESKPLLQPGWAPEPVPRMGQRKEISYAPAGCRISLVCPP
jgi:hypothetical protein